MALVVDTGSTSPQDLSRASSARSVGEREELNRIQWKAWYCLARLLRRAGCRNLARAAAQRGHQVVETVSARASKHHNTRHRWTNTNSEAEMEKVGKPAAALMVVALASAGAGLIGGSDSLLYYGAGMASAWIVLWGLGRLRRSEVR